jgi:plastocyanin
LPTSRPITVFLAALALTALFGTIASAHGDFEHVRGVVTKLDDSSVTVETTEKATKTTKTLTLTAGTYRVFCTLTTPVNHETAGMNASLTVS